MKSSLSEDIEFVIYGEHDIAAGRVALTADFDAGHTAADKQCVDNFYSNALKRGCVICFHVFSPFSLTLPEQVRTLGRQCGFRQFNLVAVNRLAVQRDHIRRYIQSRVCTGVIGYGEQETLTVVYAAPICSAV